jgi:diguanylate cyclase
MNAIGGGGTPIEILLVEDSPGDVRLVREMFDEHGSEGTEFMHVASVSEAKKLLLEREFHIILLDLGLPDACGLGAVQQVRAAAPHTPLVVVTCFDDELLAVQALQEGAQDYLVKGQIDARSLFRSLRYAIQRKNMEEALFVQKEQIAHFAQHDFLTGLPNRMLLDDRIRQAIALAPRHKKKVAVLFLDLDGFKLINDSRGHSTGDKLLQSVAKRLVSCVRESDTVSRHGGDEFVVLLSEVAKSEDAAITANLLLQAVSAAHFIDQHELHITTSVGVSVYPDDGRNAETLIQNADTAMYHAKKNGQQSCLFFKASMGVRTLERQSIEPGPRTHPDLTTAGPSKVNS